MSCIASMVHDMVNMAGRLEGQNVAIYSFSCIAHSVLPPLSVNPVVGAPCIIQFQEERSFGLSAVATAYLPLGCIGPLASSVACAQKPDAVELLIQVLELVDAVTVYLPRTILQDVAAIDAPPVIGWEATHFNLKGTSWICSSRIWLA